MLWSESRYNLAWALPICSGFLSIIGSTSIVVMMLRSTNKRLSVTYGRLVFGMSCMDIIQSLAYCFSTIPSPSDSDTHWSSYGTTLTCSIQGWFLFTGGVGTTLYYCSLCIYYVLMIAKRDITESTIKNKVEPFLHFIPLAYSITVGFFLGVTKHFNNAGTVCWIASLPRDCLQLEDVECIRGKNAYRYRLLLQATPVIIVFFIIITCMIILICAVDKQVKRMEKYEPVQENRLQGSLSPRTSAMIQQREDTKVQGLLYIGAFFCTFLFPLIHQLTYILSGHLYYILFILQNIFSPLQGFFNFIVYIRPHIKELSKDYPDMSFFQVFMKAMQSKGDEHNRRPRRRRSMTERLRDPNYNQRGLTSREIYLQQTTQQGAATFHFNNVDKDTTNRDSQIASQKNLKKSENTLIVHHERFLEDSQVTQIES